MKGTLMHRSLIKKTLAVIVIAAISALAGCGGPSSPLALRFTPASTSAQEVTITVTKDFRFEQPALDKLRQEETTTTITTRYDRTIQDVDENGWATARILLTGLKVRMIKQNEVQIDFDSERPEDQKAPLTKVIGQSYTIRLGPKGQVQVVDAKSAQAVSIPGLEGQLAKRLFADDEIQRRHEILALPDEVKAAEGQTWERIVPSPPGLLSSKSYQKVYTLSDIETRDGRQVAIVNMKAAESAVPAEGAQQTQGSMGIFAKMLDNEDEFTGSLVLDLETGSVISYEEKLISTYLAQEQNPKAKPEQGPDTLTIRFIQSVQRQQIN